MNNLGLYHNPDVFEYLPNARLNGSARDVFDILSARQQPGGEVKITQTELGRRLGIPQSNVSRAISHLKDKGIISPRTRQGRYTIHPLLAGYSSLDHMLSHLRDPQTAMWPLNFPADELRPPRRSDPRAGTPFDPDPNGGGQRAPGNRRGHLYLAAS